MNKKAVVEIGLVQLLGLILAIALIIGTVWFFARLGGVLTGSGAERATEVAFQTVVFKINELVAKEDACAATAEGQNLFVGSNYAIVGFSRASNRLPATSCSNEEVKRPIRPDCQNDKSCLCLYKTQETFKNKEPVQCASMDVDWIVMPKYGSETPASIYNNMAGLNPLYNLIQDKMTTNLFIFGECDVWGGNIRFGIQRVYIEKSRGSQGKVILIAYYDQEMEQRYEKCAKEQ